MQIFQKSKKHWKKLLKNNDLFNLISLLISNFIILLIKIYQKTLSFDHGFFKYLHPYGYCRFKPTCSEYSIQAIKKYGPIKGLLIAIWRVLRCNPWNKGGYDPIK